MKLAIVSDLHIGYDRFEEDSYRQAREALESASECADAILIPGDVFDKRAPKPEVIAVAVNIFRDISKRKWNARVVDFKTTNCKKQYTDVPIIIIPGTHERVAEGKENVLSLIALAGFAVDVSESTAVVELDGEKVAITGLGGVSEERVKECLDALNPTPLPGMFNVFMLHQSIYELLPFSDDIIKYDDLPKGFDLYVNGHIHNRVEAVVHGKKFLIPGSTVLTQLKEGEQEKKGYILFDTKTGKHEFRKINSRDFVFVESEFRDATPKEVAETVEKEIERIVAKSRDKPIVRLVLKGTTASGFTNADLPLRHILGRYSEKAIIDVDYSRLKSPDSDKAIEEIREGVIGGMSVKELGLTSFMAKLKEQKFDDQMDARRLFEILSGPFGKEKVLKEATDMIENGK